MRTTPTLRPERQRERGNTNAGRNEHGTQRPPIRLSENLAARRSVSSGSRRVGSLPLDGRQGDREHWHFALCKVVRRRDRRLPLGASPRGDAAAKRVMLIQLSYSADCGESRECLRDLAASPPRSPPTPPFTRKAGDPGSDRGRLSAWT
jgi:hypothetical protein